MAFRSAIFAPRAVYQGAGRLDHVLATSKKNMGHWVPHFNLQWPCFAMELTTSMRKKDGRVKEEWQKAVDRAPVNAERAAAAAGRHRIIGSDLLATTSTTSSS